MIAVPGYTKAEVTKIAEESAQNGNIDQWIEDMTAELRFYTPEMLPQSMR